MPNGPPTEDEIRECLRVLESLRKLEPDHPDYVRFERAVAHLTKTAKQKRRAARRIKRSQDDRAKLENASRAASYLGRERDDSVGSTLKGTRLCYTCKSRYRALDHQYQALCLACAEVHRKHRDARCDLSGRRALVTGGRIKIGFEIATRLLRDGASVTITTRFPNDALERYGALEDASSWIDRLRIVGLDFRDVRGLVEWIEAEATREPLDILINNAAQTIRRSPAYFTEVAGKEIRQLESGGAITVPDGSRDALVAFHQACVARTDEALIPAGRRDVEGLQLDLSSANSWTKTLADVSPAEMLETHLVTAVAPFLLCAGLKSSMERSPVRPRFIINVSAMEGVFSYPMKTARHPHTNMAKAALNMLTRTSAADYAESEIYMVAVDTGWITDENPEPTRRQSGFLPPLDAEDGAARIYAPIASGVHGAPIHGVFLKDFEVAPW